MCSMRSSRRRSCRSWISSGARWPPAPQQGRRSSMNRIAAPLIILVVLVLLMAGGTFYQVDETEQVVVTQFGEPARAPITTPGLKLKVPFIQTVRRFDKRVMEWDGLSGQIPTLEKQSIVLDTTARWRIADPLRFLQSVGDERSAQSRLDDLINSAVRDVVSSHLLIQTVRTFARELSPDEPDEGRDDQRAGSGTKPEAAALPTTQDVASAKIRGEKERELDRLRSEAYRKAQETIGKADAEAARIYAESYNQDPEFYAFYQTLEAYKQTLQKNSSLLLTTGSDFYRYLKYVNGGMPPPAAKEGKP